MDYFIDSFDNALMGNDPTCGADCYEDMVFEARAMDFLVDGHTYGSLKSIKVIFKINSQVRTVGFDSLL